MMSSAAMLVPRIMMRPPIESVVLHNTLVADSALLSGYELEVSSLGPVEPARRQDNRTARVTNVQVSLLLNEHNQEKAQQASEKTSADQFLIAGATELVCSLHSPLS